LDLGTRKGSGEMTRVFKGVFDIPKRDCAICGTSSEKFSGFLGVCLECIRERFGQSEPIVREAHEKSRQEFMLPGRPPIGGNAKCTLCVNQCEIHEGELGFCGLRTNESGQLKHIAGTPGKGVLEWYYDPLPTNCVADFCCPGGTGCGYPKYSSKETAEYGHKNLAVFYGACTFNCLFCQNWHYRYLVSNPKGTTTSEELASNIDDKTSCICYFGGDPTPQLAHAVKASEFALEKNKDRIMRICFETNGTMSQAQLKKVKELALKSGGTIKFDLKTFDDHLNLALCGVTNERTKENFKWLGQFIKERQEVPLLVASTLLVPGYIDAREVENIARFIAAIDDSIPYSLLAFHPQFYMSDLKATSRKQADECLQAAKAHLKNVRIGNIHLLW
jgi:pyruvate formate lyase activating enzyme